MGLIFLLGACPTFSAIGCEAGAYAKDGACPVCAAGTYSAAGATSCTNCPSPYTQTWSGNKATEHDDISDCLILITFHANGGKYMAPNDDEKTDATVGAHYYNKADGEYVESCPLPVSGNIKGIPLCENDSKKFKISENANSVWTRDGYTFAGWFKNEALTVPLSYTETFNTTLNLYAKWCEDAANVVPKDGECVCKRGYYMNGTACTKCDADLSTAEPGATSADECVKVFRYQIGSDNKFWAWPDAVTPGEFYIK